MPQGKDRFELVEKKEVDGLLHIIKPVLGRLNRYLNENAQDYTFHREIVGSFTRGTVSRVRDGNKGFDIDINLVIEYPRLEKKYDAKDVHDAFLNGLRQSVVGTPFSHPEESSSVFTLKCVDRISSKVRYGVDLAVVYYEPNGTMRFLRYDKYNRGYGFQRREFPSDLKRMEGYVREHYDDEYIAETYIRNKNANHDTDKRSFIIYAETINNLYANGCNPIHGVLSNHSSTRIRPERSVPISPWDAISRIR